VLDFMGFAQKGGSVLSFVRLADVAQRLNQVRIDTQQADAILACDMVVAASPEALQTVRHGRTRIVTNVHEIPVAESMRNPDADLQAGALLEKMRYAAGADRVETFDAQALAEEFLGDTISANIVAMGYAWQRGLVPIGLAAMRRAIELNGVAVENNLLAFSLGRLAAGNPAALRERAAAPADGIDETLDALVARGVAHLTGFQDAAWARRFEARVRRAEAAERALPGHDTTLPFTRAVARSLLKLMSYKDEYEVARLYTDGGFQRQLAEQFEGPVRLEFHMAPPLLARPKHGQPPKKMVFGPWMMGALRLLAKGKALRGGAFDPFGRTQERRMERALIEQFEARVDELIGDLDAARLPLAVQIAQVPGAMRGYGHVKIANVALARTREAELLHRYAPQRHPKPAGAPAAGQLRGIAVVAR
jgi:indolepyruvate ferredoxin oxidoreductase